MGYQSIRITGDVVEAMKALLGRTYGKVLEIEVCPDDDEGMYAAITLRRWLSRQGTGPM